MFKNTALFLIVAAPFAAFAQDTPAEGNTTESQARCPLCIAGGYGAASGFESKFNLNTVWAPGTVTEIETFLWYRPSSRYQFGIAHLGKQNAFRFLFSGNLIRETERTPSVNVMAGVQGVSEGNPGYSMTFEKNFGPANIYAGISARSNENRGRLIGGGKYEFQPGWVFGIQADGKMEHLFLTHTWGQQIAGLYLVDLQTPGFMLGYRF